MPPHPRSDLHKHAEAAAPGLAEVPAHDWCGKHGAVPPHVYLTRTIAKGPRKHTPLRSVHPLLAANQAAGSEFTSLARYMVSVCVASFVAIRQTLNTQKASKQCGCWSCHHTGPSRDSDPGWLGEAGSACGVHGCWAR